MTTPDAMTGPAAPLVSVVLPVGGVEEFLPECLDSVLGPGRPDLPAGQAGLEVIAVDDASPDGCGAILDRRAAQDPRLRVVHLTESVGPGPARMRGLAEASGAYVWFVDPDDLLAGGALAAVTERLARARPDVLLIDYEILRGPGRAEPSPGAGLLAAPPGAGGADGAVTVTLAERPALINRTMTAWSKVFRREFLLGLRVCFPPGIHEDVPVSCAALLSAARIGLLDRVCYRYRRRPRSFLAAASMANFSIFASYDSVFARLDAGVSAPVRAAVFGRAIEHYSTVLASGLVPRRARQEFFHRMAADYRRYRPPGYQRPPGLRGLKFALIERDAYRAYLVLGPLNAARVTLLRVRPARPVRRAQPAS
ncbi:MAG TPA: glycosyltransferase [Streptosporangiaceae bacterium]|nr:glycosyltransferase [Streptosporangiaceae bacterium]